jgi:2'-5' RNA ligase
MDDQIVPVTEYWDHIERTREREFLGVILRVPPRLWNAFRTVLDNLNEVDPTQLYTPSETAHISLKGLGFLGETFSEPDLEPIFSDVQEVLAKRRPFDVTISGVDHFPTSLYAKVIDPYETLKDINSELTSELSRRVEESLYDGENYVPHVTLAAFRNKNVSRLLEKVKEFRHYDFGSTIAFEAEAVVVDLLRAMFSSKERELAFKAVRVFHIG